MEVAVFKKISEGKQSPVLLMQVGQGMILVAKLKEVLSDNNGKDVAVVLSKPYIVAQNRMPNGAVGLALIPYLTFSRPQGADEVILSPDSIQAVTVLPKDDELYTQYISATSGIAIATKQPKEQKQELEQKIGIPFNNLRGGNK